MTSRSHDAVERAITSEVGEGPLADALRLLSRDGLAGALTGLSFLNTLWVAKNGNNATALRNRLDKPFLTVQAAITAALPGDVIHVMPGRYTENLVIGTNPNLTIEGDAPVNSLQAATTIDGGVTAAVTWSPANGRLKLANISLISEGTALVVLGDPAATLAEVSVENSFATGYNINAMTGVFLTDFFAGAGSIIDSGNVRWEDGSTGDLVLAYNQATAPAGMLRVLYQLVGVIVDGSLTMTGTPNIYIDPSSTVFGPTVGTFTNFVDGSHDLSPLIHFEPRTSDDVTITFAVYQTLQVSRNFIDASRSKIAGNFLVQMGSADALRSVAIAHAASLTTVEAGESVDMDIRGTTIPQTSMTATGSGTIDRDTHVLDTATFLGNLAGPTGFVFQNSADGFSGGTPLPFPTGAVYGVSYITDAISPQSLGLFAKSNTGLSVFPSTSSGGTADIEVTRN